MQSNPSLNAGRLGFAGALLALSAGLACAQQPVLVYGPGRPALR